MTELLHLSYGFEVRALADEKRSVDVVASTAAIDSYGEIVAQDWDLTRYLKNPVVLYGHNSWDMPIGFASNVRVEEGKLLATLNFVDEKASPRAEQVWQHIKQGSLRAVSVGFRTRNKPNSVDVAGKPTLVLTGNELIEISVVPIPANPEALALEAKAFQSIRALMGATPEKQNMSILVTLAALLSLPADANETSVADHVKSLSRRATDAEANLSKLLAAAGAESVDKACGVIEAGKGAVVAMAEQGKRLEEIERKSLLDKARAEKKITPAQEKAMADKPLDFVRGFLEIATPHPVLAREDVTQPGHGSSELTWKGKTWSQLSFDERHELYQDNHDLYVAMRDA